MTTETGADGPEGTTPFWEEFEPGDATDESPASARRRARRSGGLRRSRDIASPDAPTTAFDDWSGGDDEAAVEARDDEAAVEARDDEPPAGSGAPSAVDEWAPVERAPSTAPAPDPIPVTERLGPQPMAPPPAAPVARSRSSRSGAGGRSGRWRPTPASRPSPADDRGPGLPAEEIVRAAAVLRIGGLVAFPTETVYGLGADASKPDAVRRMFTAKGRPADHPVIVHVASVDAMAEWAATVPVSALALARAFWPGPLTVIVPAAAHVPREVTGGRDTVALRVPDEPAALALLTEFGGGIAAPSANRFGRVSPTTADAVREEMGPDVDVVLDGGPCRIGIESTIVDCTVDPPVIARLGGIAREAVEEVLGESIAVRDRGEVAAPGTLTHHYAPRAQVVLVDRAQVVDRSEALRRPGRRIGLLAVGHAPYGIDDVRIRVLDPPVDDQDFARVLYARFREADELGVDVLLVVPPDDTDGRGLAAAVRDRLRRAAAGSAPSPAADDTP